MVQYTHCFNMAKFVFRIMVLKKQYEEADRKLLLLS